MGLETTAGGGESMDGFASAIVEALLGTPALVAE
jgi:hypothetical protein